MNAGAGGDTYASDDIGGVKFQRVKLVEGADGTNDGDISSANPLPVDAGLGSAISLTGSFSMIISAALPAGTNNIGDVDILSFAAGAIVEVQGDVAHDAAVGGNPVLQGLEARTTNPTAVADGDAVRAIADDMGRQIIAFSPRDLVVDNHVSLSVSTTLTLLAAPGAGVFRDLTMLTISNPSATPALVKIFDKLATGAQRFAWELAADGGGIALAFTLPFKNATAQEGWSITSTELGVTATAQAIDTV